MSERDVFVNIPEELHEEVLDLARRRGLTFADLLVEALAASVAAHRRDGWVREAPASASQRPFWPHDPRMRPQSERRAAADTNGLKLIRRG